MILNLEEKKVLCAFGCPVYRNTVIRLKLLTALVVDVDAKHRLLCLVRKLDNEEAEILYPSLYEQFRAGTDAGYEEDFEEERLLWGEEPADDGLTNGRIFMMKLTKYEKETIVNFNEGEKEASIYTFNADLKRRLAEYSLKYPAYCRLESSTAEGSVTYVIDKSRLSIRLLPPYTEERRAAASALAKEHGFQSLPGGKDAA